MKKYVIDTNVLYCLVFNDSTRCNVDYIFNILQGNIGIVTYGTLFEAFDKYRNEETSLHLIMKFLNDYQFEIAGNSQQESELFWTLVYTNKELTNFGLLTLKKLLIEQTSDYINRVLGEILNAFAFFYMNIKRDKTPDAYNTYIEYSAAVTDGFSHFPPFIQKSFSTKFLVSYTQDNSEKFTKIVQKEFWGIIRSIETHYNVLSGKTPEVLMKNEWKEQLKAETSKFDRLYDEQHYLDFIKKSNQQMITGKKLITNYPDLFSTADTQAFSPLEKDFFNYCMKRLFINQGKFNYNDIIDFLNLSTAVRWADAIITLDSKFLLNTVSTFDSLLDTEFYKNSLLFINHLPS